jgi:hypothetical protein
MMKAVAANLEKLLSGETTEFCGWIGAQLPSDIHPFEKALLDADLDVLMHSFPLPLPNQSIELSRKDLT